MGGEFGATASRAAFAVTPHPSPSTQFRFRDFRAPLGRAVIGGTITSTILTLFVIPTVYVILDDWREKLSVRFRRRATGHAPEAVPVPGTEAREWVSGFVRE